MNIQIKEIIEENVLRENFLLKVVCAILSLISLITIGTLAAILDNKTTMLVTPDMAMVGTISQSHFSKEYLQKTALFFAYLRLSTTPSSMNYQYQTLLKNVEPKAYAHIREVLMTEIKQREKQNVSTMFFPTSIKVIKAKNAVRMTGELQVYAGKTLLPPAPKAYELTFSNHSGLIQLTRFKEVHA